MTASASGDLASKLAVVVVSIMAARALAPEVFATYLGLLAAAHVGAAVWDAGVSTLVTVERSRSRAPLSVLAERVVRARLLAFPAWVGAFALASLALGVATRPTAGNIASFAFVSLAISLQQPVLAAVRADLRFSQASAALFVGRWLTVVIFGGALALGLSDGDVELLGFSHLVGEAMVIVGAIVVMRRGSRDGAGAMWDGRSIGLRNALPYAANSLINIAYNRLDILVVAVLVPASQLAAYAPASRVQDALYLVPSAIAAVALPYLSRHGPHGDAGSWHTMRRLWSIGLLIAIPSTVLLTLFMPNVLAFLLGSEYSSAALPSRILAWSMPLAAIGAPLLAYMISRGRGAQTTIAFASAGIVSLALHLILDPRFGALGAATASLVRDVANVAVAGLLVWRAQRAKVGD
ncbi:MAG: oligosaccharide flippase family protein [Chloroflexota bacterium]